ncbi:MAG TPA: DUF1559 domain-containing protein [Gemmataceae bacterium]|jgi:hypothetical protein|nr:DUF1559 domain-containing protein [Gemmataceae bacterium]
MSALALLLATVCLTSPPVANAARQDARGVAVAPFIDDQTFAVVRIDATRVDVPKLTEMLKSLSGGFDESVEHAADVLSWIPSFVKAGGKELYLVSGLADLSQGPFFAIVPLTDGTDAQGILDIIEKCPAFKDQARQQLGSAVFIGSKQTLERLKTAKPVARKELASALEAAGEAAVQFLFLPTADSRRVIEELMPTLPAEVGGGSVKVLTRGILWAAVVMEAPPTTSIRFVVQAEDANKATEFANFFKSNVARLAKLPMAEKVVPGLGSMLNALTPSVAGDRVTLSLDEKNVATLLKPSARAMQDRVYRMSSMNNLKRLGLGIWNYHEVHKAFPTVANFDGQGKPLLSWRVHILPFLGEEKLYKEFHLDEPWDSDHNKKLIPRMPKVFVVPGLPGSDKGLTTYLAPVAPDAMWTGTAATVRVQDVTDGTSNTIFAVDAADKLATPWTKPADYAYNPKDPAAGLAYRYGNVATALFADGSVRGLAKTNTAKTILALFTRNGGEVVSEATFDQ